MVSMKELEQIEMMTVDHLCDAFPKRKAMTALSVILGEAVDRFEDNEYWHALSIALIVVTEGIHPGTNWRIEEHMTALSSLMKTACQPIAAE